MYVCMYVCMYSLSQQMTFSVLNFLKLINFNELVILVIVRKRENDSNRVRKKNKERKDQREQNRELVILRKCNLVQGQQLSVVWQLLYTII